MSERNVRMTPLGYGKPIIVDVARALRTCPEMMIRIRSASVTPSSPSVNRQNRTVALRCHRAESNGFFSERTVPMYDRWFKIRVGEPLAAQERSGSMTLTARAEALYDYLASRDRNAKPSWATSWTYRAMNTCINAGAFQ
jgi:hypothetical protein